MLELVRGCSSSMEGWSFKTGTEVHTWTGGMMNYFIGIKDVGGKKMQ